MELLQPLAAVVLVLALLCGALFLLKKRGAATFQLPRLASPQSPRRMEVLERVTLGPQQALHLVRVGDRSIVIVTSASTAQAVCELECQQ